MFSYEFHQLLLGVRLARDCDWLLHEGLIEIHFVQLQGQLLGHLKRQRQVTQDLRCLGLFAYLFVCYLQLSQMWQRT